ncbi:unnamed protein product [Penicillium manginii]
MGSHQNGASLHRIYENKLAIVTGSARSIGAAIVRNLASKGCNVIINHATESSDDAAEILAKDLGQVYFIRALALRADISSSAECERLVSTAKTHFASSEKFQIDIIVHNAAILYLGSLESVIENEF